MTKKEAQKEISKMNEKISEANKRITNLKNKISDNKNTNKQYNKNINTNKSKIKELTKSKENYAERIQNLKNVYQAGVDAGDTEPAILEQLKAEIKKMEDDDQKIDQQIKSLEKKNKDIQAKKAKLQKQNENYNKQINNAKVDISNAKTTIAFIRSSEVGGSIKANDHEDWQKYAHYKKGAWNVVSVTSKTTTATLVLQKPHNSWSKGFNGNWGAVKESAWNKIKGGSKSKDNSVKPLGALYNNVKKYNEVKITKRISKGKWDTKTVKFWYIPKLKRWVVERTADSDTVILKVISKGKGSGGGNGASNQIGDEVIDDDLSPSKLYKEDTIDAKDYDDDTDESDKDFPNGLSAHSVSTFIKKVYKDGNGYGKKHYAEESEYNDKGHHGANINSNKDFKHLVRSRGIWNQDIHKWAYQYNRMQWANPDYAIGNTREYLFFTKPDLGILNRKTGKLVKGLGNDPFWTEMINKYRDVIQMLQYSAPKVTTGESWMAKSARYVKRKEFITLLTNAVSGSLDLPGSSAETTETGSTIYGTTIQYRKGAWKSDEGYDFSLEFIDSPYLQVYHLFKMWEEYTKMKDIGAVSPPGSRNCNPYRINKILHDQIGIFKFIVGEDMETIRYYAYLTGCFPKSVPRDSFNNINPGAISYSIDWHAQFVEDMNPLILIHFNNIMRKELGCKLTGKAANALNMKPHEKPGMGKQPAGIAASGYEYIPIYNAKYGHINGGFRSYPVIGMVNDMDNPGRYKYVLRWYDPRQTKK